MFSTLLRVIYKLSVVDKASCVGSLCSECEGLLNPLLQLGV